MNANIMKEDIEEYAELTEVYTSWDILGLLVIFLFGGREVTGSRGGQDGNDGVVGKLEGALALYG